MMDNKSRAWPHRIFAFLLLLVLGVSHAATSSSDAFLLSHASLCYASCALVAPNNHATYSCTYSFGTDSCTYSPIVAPTALPVIGVANASVVPNVFQNSSQPIVLAVPGYSIQSPPWSLEPNCSKTAVQSFAVSDSSSSPVFFHAYDADSGQSIPDLSAAIYADRESFLGNNAALGQPDGSVRLDAQPGQAYEAILADRSYRHIFTQRQFTVQSGTGLNVSLCMRKASVPLTSNYSGAYDTLRLELVNASSLALPASVDDLLPPPTPVYSKFSWTDVAAKLLGLSLSSITRHPPMSYPEPARFNGMALRVSSTVSGAFGFNSGTPSTNLFYLLSDGRAFAKTSTGLVPIDAYGRINYLADQKGSHGIYLSGSRLYISDDLGNYHLGDFIVDNDFQTLQCPDCYGNGDALWAQTFGWPDVRDGQPDNKIMPGFASPSGLRYDYSSDTVKQFRVPLDYSPA